MFTFLREDNLPINNVFSPQWPLFGNSCVMYGALLQGDAAFWWNLKKSGEGDMLTRHAGCPVLVGTKWGRFLLVVHYLSHAS